MDLPPSHRRRNLRGYGPLLRPSGPIRSSTFGDTHRSSPYPSRTNVDARNRTASHPSDDEDFEKSCFNDVYCSDEEVPSSRTVRFQSTQPSRTPPPSTSPGTKDKTSAASNDDEDSTDDEEDGKIPKPSGEVGRPNRGGYNLRVTLGWEDDRYDKVKAFINSLVDNHLDGKIPLTEQTLVNVQTVRDKAVVKYKFLDEYRDHWATTDFIKTRLKVRKSALEKKEGEKALAEVRKDRKKSAAAGGSS